MKFEDAYKLEIGQHVEKKNGFNYLSWSYAVKFLREKFPTATWVVKEDESGVPLFPCPDGYMVHVSVILDTEDGFGRYSQWHAVTNFANKSIAKPTSADVSNAIQRCLTKAIALATGIGLGLYAGEDLPKEETQPKKQPAKTQGKQKVAKVIPKAKADQLIDIIEDTKTDMDKLLSHYNVESVDKMTVDQYEDAMTMLAKKMMGSK